jgi:hypothetical protein
MTRQPEKPELHQQLIGHRSRAASPCHKSLSRCADLTENLFKIGCIFYFDSFNNQPFVCSKSHFNIYIGGA